jgi:hypothetical protein
MITLEQIVCWFVGLLLLVAAFRYLVKEKLSFSFVLCLCAIAFFFFGLSGVQGLLKTGLLVTVKDSLVKYGEKLDGFQSNVVAMRVELSQQQSAIFKAQLDVAAQQVILTNQNQKVAQVQKELTLAQAQVNEIAAKLAEQQKEINNQQMDLSSQQTTIRQAQTNIAFQEMALNTQFNKMTDMQQTLDLAQAALGKQQKKIETVESLINSLYARTVTEYIPVTDANRVTTQSLGLHTRVFFRLQDEPIPNSIEASVRTHPGVIRGLMGLVVGAPFNQQFSIAVGNNKNVVYTDVGAPTWDKLEFPQNSIFVFRYAKLQGQTNLWKAVTVKHKKVFFDQVEQVFK